MSIWATSGSPGATLPPPGSILTICKSAFIKFPEGGFADSAFIKFNKSRGFAELYNFRIYYFYSGKLKSYPVIILVHEGTQFGEIIVRPYIFVFT